MSEKNRLMEETEEERFNILKDIRSFTRRDLENLAMEMGEPAFRGRQLFRWLWRPEFKDFQDATDLSVAFREKIGSISKIYSLKTLRKEKSVDGTIKWAWQLYDRSIIETVLIPEKDHTTVCLSTQAGCAMGCRFCHTSKMGFIRDLDPSEIAGQVLSIMALTNPEQHPRNIVFMGMGEPLANYDSLIYSIHILKDELGLNFSGRRITVSTCGLVDGIKRLGMEDVDVGLAISLHAPSDTLRSSIMPVNRRFSISELLNACKEFRMKPRRRITFEYLLLGGVNDREEHAEKLAFKLQGIPAKVNLIPFNESKGIPFKRPDVETVQKFQDVLKEKGYTVIIRKSKGVDISAACGQLYAKTRRTP